jgi:tripartite-type tricarboxylate transporter receptor subunit TctC
MVDLVGGQIRLVFANPATAMTFVRSGKVRAIAMTGETRLDAGIGASARSSSRRI